MALICAVGKSKAAEGRIAGRQAAQDCLNNLTQAPTLILLFCSPHYAQEHVLAGIREIFPESPILGCSSAAEIHHTGSDEQSVVLSALAGIQVTLQPGGNIREDSFEAGRLLGQRLAAHPAQVLLMFSDALAGNGSAVVQGVQAGLNRSLPVVGGAASDEFLFQKTYQYINTQVLTQTVVGAALEGDFVFGVGVRHGWEPVGLPVTVTKSQGHRLYELNGCPAVQFYEEYFGEYFNRQSHEVFGRLAVLYPMGMAIPDSAEYLLRAPFSVEADGSVNYAADLPEKAEVRLMIGSVEGAIKAARIAAMEALSQMQGRKPKLALIFNCIARRKVLGRRADEEIAAIRDIIGHQVPVAGFYTYGEIAPAEGIKGNSISFHNETVVILLLG
jgi:hypothetical protein